MRQELKNKEWREFVLSSLFDIKSTSSSIDKSRLNNRDGSIPYITRTDKNNGIDIFVVTQDAKYELDPGNVITIGLDTQTVFFQATAFYTGQNIQILHSSNLNKYVAAFLIPLLKRLMEKFNWGGNGATLTRLKRSKVLLPINIIEEPDYEFMEAYMREKESALLEHYKKYAQTLDIAVSKQIKPLSAKEWKEFFVEDIAEILSGKDIYEAERVKGCNPYITATASNNGIGYFVSNNNETCESNCLSVNRNGSVGYSFFHTYPALFSNDCRKLRLKHSSKHIGQFIACQITAQKDKYGYGYKMGTGRLKRQKIMLPINEKEDPDFLYMEQYMKQVESKQLTKYLTYINNRK
ncbi:restriction endonuclease subunit S [Dysgonomonas capnocytophagoides]|uniref:restriction endonuclease subunit S n=1 Tax=Dysgonomonas capnocytophagoides TaxID=45254 RepID=UPI00040DFC8B|nr:restriction endonuclease subunit S [Dysgonomonas capnocytophagoides]